MTAQTLKQHSLELPTTVGWRKRSLRLGSLHTLNEQYFLGNFWQFWIGPQFDPTDPESERLNREVQRVFQSRNKIKECVKRHLWAVTGKPYAWYIANETGERLQESNQEKTLARILEWMLPKSATPDPDEGKEDLQFPHAIAEAFYHRLMGGKGYLRLWKPERFQNGPVERRVSLHAPHPDDVEVVRDESKLPYQIRYKYQIENQDRVEVQELGDDGQTYFWTEDASGEASERTALDLGGRFTIQELSGPPLISQSIREQQDGLNYLLTMWLRGLSYAGFLEDIITNGLPPGTFDEDGNFIPSQQGLRRGPGSTQWIGGRPIMDPETGSVTGYTTPQVTTKQPVEVTSFVETEKRWIVAIYEEFNQGHVLGADMPISGVSRVQSRQDFALSCQQDAAALRVALADLYACTLILAGEAGPDVRLVVEPRLAIADPLPEEKAEIRADFEADLLSQHTAMSRGGVEDPDAEIDLIAEEKRARLELNEELGLDEFLGNPSNDDDEADPAPDGPASSNSGGSAPDDSGADRA